MTIETLISDAKARQDARTEAYREEQEHRAHQAGETLRNQFIAAFGDTMLTTLDAYVSSPIDESAHITFRYGERNYSLRRVYRDGVLDWVLTWLAPRADGDERRLPHTRIPESRRDDQANIDALVLALADLDAESDTPHTPHRTIPDLPPRVMNEFEKQLLDALRQYLQSER